MNSIGQTDLFRQQYGKLDYVERKWIDRVFCRLERDLTGGKPLGCDWLRERKCRGKRLLYVVNEKRTGAVLVAFATKKEQGSIIGFIMKNKEKYLALLR
ncbi:hypothetical protein C4580_01655 [Candidatus Woesearchaeota archaeon]|nr:MAG: hypothetical protein C4580_01655 [Candidatus Woesearchaeota archaeon]